MVMVWSVKGIYYEYVPKLTLLRNIPIFLLFDFGRRMFQDDVNVQRTKYVLYVD